MQIHALKSKIHRATVVQAELNYIGSITIDEALMEQAGIAEYEKVQIVDVDNGQRFETYVICGEKDSGMICLNGAAARMVAVGDSAVVERLCKLTRCHPRALTRRRGMSVYLIFVHSLLLIMFSSIL